ncbi:MAG: tRNA 2-thiouridine(34) synthase MnmA [Gammaproteobacteria bacterium]|nr:tRNA 2-thiouridine(34) synthase MnmA [Gammaproteobacteria bacterium]
MPGKIIIGLSGGVDSAVSALLMKRRGLAVEALFMKNWEEDDNEHCAAAEDLASARRVAGRLGIALHTVNFSAEYWDDVFARFLSEYRRGRTPNPDVLCNREIKFRAFIEHAGRLGAGRIATGHYARIEARNGHRRLMKGLDPDKDQSYFLYALDQRSLACSVFPLAELHKSEVRDIAKEHGLACHDRKDSTGICFIGERKFREFLARYLPPRPGDIVDRDGCVIGRHQGCWYYTIGQRKGLGIGGARDGSGDAWYVAAKDVRRNTLSVVQGANHPLLFRDRLRASAPHWINEAPRAGEPLTGKIRYRQRDQSCIIANLDADAVEVVFNRPQRAVAPGQSIVFYRGRECLGGAVIE